MRDTKSLLLIIISILLITVSMFLLWTWGYKIGNKSGSQDSKIVVLNDTSQISSAAKDSLFEVYVNAMNNLKDLDLALNRADSLKSDINSKIGEFYQMKDQLLSMLKKPVTQSVVIDADAKMSDLKKRVDQLKVQNSNIEKENKRLARLISQLPADMKPATLQAKDSVYAAIADTASASAIDVVAPAVAMPSTMVSEMEISFLADKNGSRINSELASEVEKITGGFSFVCPKDATKAGYLYIVVSCPDGKVMKSSGWDTGAFESKEGRKVFTSSIRYEMLPGEVQQLNFAVPYDAFVAGDYLVEVYYEGKSVAQFTKKLL